MERDIFITGVESSHLAQPIELPEIALQELMLSFQEVLKRAEMFTSLHLLKEPLSVRERMATILEQLKNKGNSGNEEELRKEIAELRERVQKLENVIKNMNKAFE